MSGFTFSSLKFTVFQWVSPWTPFASVLRHISRKGSCVLTVEISFTLHLISFISFCNFRQHPWSWTWSSHRSNWMSTKAVRPHRQLPKSGRIKTNFFRGANSWWVMATNNPLSFRSHSGVDDLLHSSNFRKMYLYQLPRDFYCIILEFLRSMVWSRTSTWVSSRY